MIQKIGFCTAITSGNFQKLRTVEAFDDYFSLRGRKYEVIKVGENNICEVNDISKKKQYLLLNVLKVISYMTIITPLIMLIGKAIARSRFEFELHSLSNQPVKVLSDEDATLDIQSLVRVFLAKATLKDLRKKREQKVLQLIYSLHEFAKNERMFFEQFRAQGEFMARQDFAVCLSNESAFGRHKDKFTLLFNHSDRLTRGLGRIASYFTDIELNREIKEELQKRSLSDLQNEIRAFCQLLSGNEVYLSALSEVLENERQICAMINRDALNKLPDSLGNRFDPTTIIMQRFTRFPIMLEAILARVQALGLNEEADLIRKVHGKISEIVTENNLKQNICLAEFYLERHEELLELVNNPSWWSRIAGGMQVEMKQLHDSIAMMLANVNLSQSNCEDLAKLCVELSKIMLPVYRNRLLELQEKQNVSFDEELERDSLPGKIQRAQELIASRHPIENSWQEM